MLHPQNATNFPRARSGNDQDIIAAANERAAFWNYPTGGPWTVYVTLGKRDIAVHKSAEGEHTISR